jgi:hypothetical protein
MVLLSVAVCGLVWGSSALNHLAANNHGPIHVGVRLLDVGVECWYQSDLQRCLLLWAVCGG